MCELKRRMCVVFWKRAVVAYQMNRHFDKHDVIRSRRGEQSSTLQISLAGILIFIIKHEETIATVNAVLIIGLPGATVLCVPSVAAAVEAELVGDDPLSLPLLDCALSLSSKVPTEQQS